MLTTQIFQLTGHIYKQQTCIELQRENGWVILVKMDGCYIINNELFLSKKERALFLKFPIVSICYLTA